MITSFIKRKKRFIVSGLQDLTSLKQQTYKQRKRKITR